MHNSYPERVNSMGAAQDNAAQQRQIAKDAADRQAAAKAVANADAALARITERQAQRNIR